MSSVLGPFLRVEGFTPVLFFFPFHFSLFKIFWKLGIKNWKFLVFLDYEEQNGVSIKQECCTDENNYCFSGGVTHYEDGDGDGDGNNIDEEDNNNKDDNNNKKKGLLIVFFFKKKIGIAKSEKKTMNFLLC